MIKKCLVCGKEFKCSPSDKIVTCSRQCLSIRRGQVSRGRKLSNKARANMSEAAKKKESYDNLKKGTPAAQKSPKSGRFDTNINAKDWVLISPEGIRYECHSMINFIRKNPELFGINGDDESVNRCAAGIRTIKGNILHGRRGHTYHGWTVIVK